MMKKMLVIHHQDVSAARFKLAVQDLLGKRMRHDFVNLSVIMDQLEPCVALNKDATPLLLSYLQKASSDPKLQ